MNKRAAKNWLKNKGTFTLTEAHVMILGVDPYGKPVVNPGIGKKMTMQILNDGIEDMIKRHGGDYDLAENWETKTSGQNSSDHLFSINIIRECL